MRSIWYVASLLYYGCLKARNMWTEHISPDENGCRFVFKQQTPNFFASTKKNASPQVIEFVW